VNAPLVSLALQKLLVAPVEEMLVVEVLQGTTVAQRGRLPPSAPRLALAEWTANVPPVRCASELLPVAPVELEHS
jgi:hypothetical protein